jgi:hypothetical protein
MPPAPVPPPGALQQLPGAEDSLVLCLTGKCWPSHSAAAALPANHDDDDNDDQRIEYLVLGGAG